MKLRYLVPIIAVAACFLCALIWSANYYHGKYQNEKDRADNAQREVEAQGEIIAAQALNFQHFNQVAEHTNRLNSLIEAGTEKTVIEYREILRREKTCDLPVPADVAGGLLEYTNSLRASAMHTDTGRPYQADDSTVTASRLTYCQAVLWIKPLLSVIEKGNNQLSGIREINEERNK